MVSKLLVVGLGDVLRQGSLAVQSIEITEKSLQQVAQDMRTELLEQPREQGCVT